MPAPQPCPQSFIFSKTKGPFIIPTSPMLSSCINNCGRPIVCTHSTRVQHSQSNKMLDRCRNSKAARVLLKLKITPEAIIYAFFPLPAGLLGPSTARSTCPAMPSLLASNWLPMAPSLLNGPPTAWPMEPIAPSGLNCLPIAPAEEMMLGFWGGISDSLVGKGSV